MNINNLKVGMTIKDYPTLCEVLEMEKKKDNSKKAQLKELKRFIDYKQEGRNFIIKEIYETPKPKVEKRGGSRNTLPFLDELEILLIDLLLQQDTDKMIKSNSRLLLELCMFNNHYWKYFNNKDTLSELVDMDINFILDFYDSTNSTFKSAINSVIKRLQNKALATHDIPIMVIKVDTDATIAPKYKTRASDIVEYDDNKGKYLVKTDHLITEEYRIATNDELKKILEIEHDTLTEKYGKESKQQLFANGMINKYYIDVSNRVYKTLDIRKHYRANRFIFDRDNLKKEYKKLLKKNNINNIKEIMNNKTIERIVNNSENKKKNSYNLDESSRTERDKSRLKDNYIDSINYLGKSIIKYDNEIVLDKLIESKQKVNELTPPEQTEKVVIVRKDTYIGVDEYYFNIDDE